MAALGIEGPIAAVTAGWQDREAEDDELREHLGGRTVNLELYRRAEELFADDPRLFAGHRRRQDSLREVQRALPPPAGPRHGGGARAAGRTPATRSCSRRPAETAIAAVRQLDAEHLETVRRIHRRFRRELRPDRRAGLRRQQSRAVATSVGCERAGDRRRPRRRPAQPAAPVRRSGSGRPAADRRLVGRRDGAGRARRPLPRQPAAGRRQRRGARGRPRPPAAACCPCRTPAAGCGSTTRCASPARAPLRTVDLRRPRRRRPADAWSGSGWTRRGPGASA